MKKLLEKTPMDVTWSIALRVYFINNSLGTKLVNTKKFHIT